MLTLFTGKKSLLFFPIIVLALFISTSAFPFDFEAVRSNISHKEIDPSFGEEYLREMQYLYGHENASVDPSIQYVWVLAGRGSYLKQPVDAPNVKDPEDDYNRLELGIDVARQVTALRSKKSVITEEDIEAYGPQIIYNGRPKHNDDLQQALQERLLTHYPRNKFVILDLPPQELSTRGQFISLSREMPLSDTSVAIITHAYHFPRVARMLESKWNPFGSNTEVFFYLVDRKLEAPGAEEDVVGEMKKIPSYIDQGDLTPQISSKIKY
jgi:hypothetical protein